VEFTPAVAGGKPVVVLVENVDREPAQQRVTAPWAVRRWRPPS
jgi:hypothetical protein